MNPRRRSVALVALLLAGCTTETALVRETTPPVAATAPATTTLPATKTSPTTTRTTPTTIAPSNTAPETTTSLLSPVEVQAAAAVPPVAKAPTLPVPKAPPDPNAQEALVTLGTIEIPRIGLNTSLYEGIAIPTFDRGPGHWPGTALPGGLGNVVIGGHRTSHARPFRHLDKLLPGDEVIFTTDAGRFVYHVVRTEIVTPDSMWIVNQTEAYTATLFACNPVGSTRERIVVFLELSV